MANMEHEGSSEQAYDSEGGVEGANLVQDDIQPLLQSASMYRESTQSLFRQPDRPRTYYYPVGF
jgi:hypothetical protein